MANIIGPAAAELFTTYINPSISATGNQKRYYVRQGILRAVSSIFTIAIAAIATNDEKYELMDNIVPATIAYTATGVILDAFQIVPKITSAVSRCFAKPQRAPVAIVMDDIEEPSNHSVVIGQEPNNNDAQFRPQIIQLKASRQVKPLLSSLLDSMNINLSPSNLKLLNKSLLEERKKNISDDDFVTFFHASLNDIPHQ